MCLPNRQGFCQGLALHQYFADLERDFRSTIRKGQSVEDMARRGREFVTDKPSELRELAASPDAFTKDLFFLEPGEEWKPPAGAFKRCGGPS